MIMSRSNVYDMTKGSEWSLLLKFSLPMLFGNIFQQLYNIVDSVIVGRFVGSDALGAVGATSSITYLFFSLCLGLSIGIGILIAQYFGANNIEGVKKAIANSIYIMIVSGILMSVLGVAFARPILELMQTPEAIIDDSVAYMQIVCGGTFAVAAYNAISSILRALGDSKTPLVFLIIASLINVVLDLVFVINFNMGVRGAGYATVISQMVSAIGCIFYSTIRNPFFKLKKEHMRYDRFIVGKSIRIGVPVALQNAMISISCIILQSVVNQFGKNIVTVFTTTNRIEQLVQQPFNTLGAAISTFTGQNMGAGRLDRVKKGFRISTIIVLIFSGLMLITMRLFGAPIVRMFTEEQNIIELGAKALNITSCFYFPLGMIYISRSLLNGSGDALASMINGIMEVLGRVLFPIILVNIFAVGYWGVWYTSGFTWTITGIVGVLRYLQGKWKYKTLVHKESE